jgi:hypothetical protein
MRYFLIVIVILECFALQAQNESAAFNAKFRLKNGIYTSNVEIMNNDPKYPECMLEVDDYSLFGRASYNYYKENSEMLPYTDSLFAFVKSGILTIYFGNKFRRLIVTGAVSLFFTESTISYTNGYSHTDDRLLYFDLITGEIGKLNPRNMDEIFKRDTFIYSEYSQLSEIKGKKALYSTVIKFNMRNPIYIRTE